MTYATALFQSNHRTLFTYVAVALASPAILYPLTPTSRSNMALALWGGRFTSSTTETEFGVPGKRCGLLT